MAQHDMTGRPLSPHLQIYRPMLTTMLSIAHRLTGAGLYFAAVVLAWWLIALAGGPEAYAGFRDMAGSIVGRLVLFGITWSLMHHMLGGLRHLVWDTGRGFELGTVEVIARLILFGSIGLTLGIWIIGYWAGVAS